MNNNSKITNPQVKSGATSNVTPKKARVNKGKAPKEIGGRSKGLEPTRYGDWEKNGRCIDF